MAVTGRTPQPLPWSRCLLIGAGLAAAAGAFLGWRSGFSLNLAKAAVENALLVALVARGVSEGQAALAAPRLFRFFALALGLLAANRLAFYGIERLLAR